MTVGADPKASAVAKSCNNLLQRESVLHPWCYIMVKLVNGKMGKLEMQ